MIGAKQAKLAESNKQGPVLFFIAKQGFLVGVESLAIEQDLSNQKPETGTRGVLVERFEFLHLNFYPVCVLYLTKLHPS